MTLNGKVALVTGASSGIGAATARKLAENGVKVGLAARRLGRLASIQEQICAAGGNAIAIQMDVADAASVKAGTGKLAAAYGAIDVVFNNAGLMPASDIETLKVSEWQRMVDVNVAATAEVARKPDGIAAVHLRGHAFRPLSLKRGGAFVGRARGHIALSWWLSLPIRPARTP